MKYAPIHGFPAYRAREDGVVESTWVMGRHYPGKKASEKWRPLNPQAREKDGYKIVTLCNDTTQRRTYLHRVILEAFAGPCPDRCCARHLDGDSTNNHVSNLAWGSYKENEDDKRLHGTHRTRITNAKLTPSDRELILNYRKKGETMAEIAKKVGVSRPSISRFLNRRTWNEA